MDQCHRKYFKLLKSRAQDALLFCRGYIIGYGEILKTQIFAAGVEKRKWYFSATIILIPGTATVVKA